MHCHFIALPFHLRQHQHCCWARHGFTDEVKHNSCCTQFFPPWSIRKNTRRRQTLSDKFFGFFLFVLFCFSFTSNIGHLFPHCVTFFPRKYSACMCCLFHCTRKKQNKPTMLVLSQKLNGSAQSEYIYYIECLWFWVKTYYGRGKKREKENMPVVLKQRPARGYALMSGDVPYSVHRTLLGWSARSNDCAVRWPEMWLYWPRVNRTLCPPPSVLCGVCFCQPVSSLAWGGLVKYFVDRQPFEG